MVVRGVGMLGGCKSVVTGENGRACEDIEQQCLDCKLYGQRSDFQQGLSQADRQL